MPPMSAPLDSGPSTAPNVFRAVEKQYRFKPSKHDASLSLHSRKQRRQRQQHSSELHHEFDNVIELRSIDDNTEDNRARIAPITAFHRQHLTNERATAYQIQGCDGLIVISEALTDDEVLSLANTALSEYSNATHTNLTNLYGPQSNHWRSVCDRDDWTQFSALRWASLGYHYNWTNREYSPLLRSPFPPSLAALSERMARCVGLEVKPEAGIVNYYSLESSMGGHRDDAELTMKYPIISLSLGQSAVFLIGGHSRDDAPTPVWLHSGDCLIMSESARQCYHAVPRIVKTRDFTLPSATSSVTLAECGTQLREWQCVVECLNRSRLNLNIRQVEDDEHTFSKRKPSYSHSHTTDTNADSDGEQHEDSDAVCDRSHCYQ